MRYKYLLPLLTRLNYKLLGKHPLHAQFNDISCAPFFILGSGRNGSTLLSMILNGHSQLMIPPEQYALHYAAIRFQLYNFLIWQDIVKIVVGDFANSKNNEGWNVNFNSLYQEINEVPKKKRSFQLIVDKIIQYYAQQHRITFDQWGDKSPSTIWFIEEVSRIYPTSKYIFLIRDGRDVVSSYFKGGEKAFGELAKIENAAENWKKSIENWKWLKKKIRADQLLEVRYEELVSDPQETIQNLCDFLGYLYEPNMLNIENVVRERAETNRSHYQGLRNPINHKSIGKWKETLNERQMATILPLIEKGLKAYNYL